MKKSGHQPERIDLLQGTLDMLILKTLLFGRMHGHGIAHSIERGTEDVLQVEHGSLYPALRRLQNQGWIDPSGAFPRTTGRRDTTVLPRPAKSAWLPRARNGSNSRAPSDGS